MLTQWMSSAPETPRIPPKIAFVAENDDLSPARALNDREYDRLSRKVRATHPTVALGATSSAPALRHFESIVARAREVYRPKKRPM